MVRCGIVVRCGVVVRGLLVDRRDVEECFRPRPDSSLCLNLKFRTKCKISAVIICLILQETTNNEHAGKKHILNGVEWGGGWGMVCFGMVVRGAVAVRGRVVGRRDVYKCYVCSLGGVVF